MPTQNKWGPIAFLTTVAVVIILITLWQYKEIVGAVLLVLLIAGVVVTLRGNLNEQGLRHLRYQPKLEEPLPSVELPYHWREPHMYSGPAVYDERQLPLYDHEPCRYHPQGDFYQHEPDSSRD